MKNEKLSKLLDEIDYQIKTTLELIEANVKWLKEALKKKEWDEVCLASENLVEASLAINNLEIIRNKLKEAIK